MTGGKKRWRTERVSDMMLINFEGKIVPKGRPRRGRNGIMYTPKKTRDFEEYVSLVTKMKVKEPLKSGLEVSILVKKKPPKSWSKKKKKEAIEGKIIANVTPDVDNYAKSILDGMNGVAFEDDAQIIELTVRKEYSKNDGAIVEIVEIDGESPY